jgi:hypothetical protein
MGMIPCLRVPALSKAIWPSLRATHFVQPLALDSGQPRTSSLSTYDARGDDSKRFDTRKRLQREDGFQQDDPKVEGQPQHTQVDHPAITKSREAHKVRRRPRVDATTTTAIRSTTVTFRSSTPQAYEPNRMSFAAGQEEQAQEAEEGWSR